MLVSTYFEIVGQQQRGLDLYGFVTGPFWGRMKCYTRRVGLGSSCATAVWPDVISVAIDAFKLDKAW